MAEDTAELVRELVTAAHWNLPRVQEIVQANPHIINQGHNWSPEDCETAIQAAAQTGNRTIARFLLKHGARLDICTAAMLGMTAEIEEMLAADGSQIHAHGAHGISLLAHAAMSGDATLVQQLYSGGATEGASLALGNAVRFRHGDIVVWLLRNTKPDLTWKDYEGKSLVQLAQEAKEPALEKLLISAGAI